MADDRLRRLERRWKETNDPQDEVRFLRARLRAEGIEPELPRAGRCAELVEQAFLHVRQGIPILTVLDLIAEQAEPHLRPAVEDVAERVRSGSNIAPAMRAHLEQFGLAIVALVDHGELSGCLELAEVPMVLAARIAADPSPAAERLRPLHTLLCLLQAGHSLSTSSRILKGIPAAHYPEIVREVIEAIPQRGLAVLDEYPQLLPRPLPWLIDGATRHWPAFKTLDAIAEAVLEGRLALPDQVRQVSLGRALWRLFFLLGQGVGAGVPFPRLVGALPPWLGHAELGAATLEMAERARSHPLAETLDRHPALFPRSLRELIRLAEACGNFEETCLSIARSIESGVIRA